MSEYPLFPELPEEGQKEAQELIDKFKANLKKMAEETIGELYCDVMPHIESDSWINFRNDLMAGLQNYNNRNLQAPYDFKQIRQAIFKEFREEIIEDLNQDMLEEIKSLKMQIKFLQERWR